MMGESNNCEPKIGWRSLGKICLLFSESRSLSERLITPSTAISMAGWMEGVLAALQYHGSDQPQEPPLGTSYLVTRGASFMNAFAVIRLYSIYSLWQKWLWIPRKIGSIFCIVEPGNPELEPHSSRPASASKSGHPHIWCQHLIGSRHGTSHCMTSHNASPRQGGTVTFQ
ncbi:uncharacterized protein K444DRAFT_105359 [Hyaloscypha bicolor E]|uniref:Uncharacterized protein n=1 Tax=Hyaloscypha bicolor E TaxID=1095630 RepID=A0A2J6SUR8_9HELO|nr:uncharacterized protein K444DRAFT_105359 [Hyaloscypha bicolor E]PMD54510.1 hypothetical protein K444DRAFT_105359 [Hyaloscypha bicolor E]